MNLQLTDLKNHQLQRSFSLGGAVPSPTETSRNQMYLSNGNDEEVTSGEKIGVQDSMNSASDESDTSVPSEVKEESFDQNRNDKNESSLELGLPDSLFASPSKSAATDHQTVFSTDLPETDYGAAISVNVTPKCEEKKKPEIVKEDDVPSFNLTDFDSPSGHVNVAPRHLTAVAETLLSATLIHEEMHVLGFDPHAFTHFRDERKKAA